ncbi:MAG: TPM domain-containing protein, partial [Pyrinomonadaceae bacterium]
MRKIFLPRQFKLLLAALTLVFVGFNAFGQESQPFSINNSPLPAPTGFVNDYAGVIDASTKQQLETKIKNLKDTTDPSVELAVAVIKTTGDRQIFEYSLAVARGWKIGSKADDNPSALLLVAIDDRKYFTQVSKDLEDELPDGVVGNLQRQYLVPEFRKGNYGKGISDTIDAYIATIKGKSTSTAAPQKPAAGREDSAGSSVFGIFCCAVVVLIILLIIFS